jgi:hypothetical protein
MSQTKHAIHAVVAAVSILAIGVVSGVLLDRTVLSHAYASPHSSMSARSLDEQHRTFMRDLTADLGLTQTQAAQVHEVLARNQSAVDEAWSTVHTLIASTIDNVTAEIEAILDAEQRQELHEWLLERHGMSVTPGGGEGH